MRDPTLSHLVAISLLLTGCATLMHGTREKIAVDSTPPAARVTIDGFPLAVTPGVIELARLDTQIVLRFEREGYEPGEFILNRKYCGWLGGNVALGFLGVAGGAIDLHTGAAYTLVPTKVAMVLEAREGGEDTLSPGETEQSADPHVPFYLDRPANPISRGRRGGRLLYGYGMSAAFHHIAVPSAEAGIRVGPVTVRGNAGYSVYVAEARLEVALNDGLYIFDGANRARGYAGAGDIFGVGMDIGAPDKSRYVRYEYGFWEPQRGGSLDIPRIAAGWRF